jgi:hypothetical protein
MSLPIGESLLFDDAIRLTSVRITLAVVSDAGTTWYATGTMTPETARRGQHVVEGSAGLSTSSAGDLRVLSSSDQGNVDGGNSSVTQPYYAGHNSSSLSLQIVRENSWLEGITTSPIAQMPAAFQTEAYSGLVAILKPSAKSAQQVGLYLVGGVYVGVAPDWSFESFPSPGLSAVFMLTLYLPPSPFQEVSDGPHRLSPGEAVEGRLMSELKGLNPRTNADK